ncbi:DUF779 domain-containing protein [Mycolicibacterium pyrenivorans]|uniref:DUF779 domain-containing protein n=1 Tax=Mycolicibacterium pyrenivorans TaxID=187102 RepID=UPI0021F2D277|nr:DUF779 domain-containing protein [Mycolicibacterium pyrenivorans]MCV7151417.1 DUF779 domain-containing protein [Mycolicibacterium pyrenivorans]
MDVPNRALVTEAAAELLRRLQERHGALMFHQSGGCCDGSSPMCYPDGDFLVGDRDVLLAVLDVGGADARSKGTFGVPVWISGPQFDAWKHTQLVIDVVPGRGGGFSLEAPEGMRFLSRGRAFTADENSALAALPLVTGADFERGERPPSNGTHIVAEGVDACAIPLK